MTNFPFSNFSFHSQLTVEGEQWALPRSTRETLKAMSKTLCTSGKSERRSFFAVLSSTSSSLNWVRPARPGKREYVSLFSTHGPRHFVRFFFSCTCVTKYYRYRVQICYILGLCIYVMDDTIGAPNRILLYLGLIFRTLASPGCQCWYGTSSKLVHP